MIQQSCFHEKAGKKTLDLINESVVRHRSKPNMNILGKLNFSDLRTPVLSAIKCQN